MKSLSIFYIDPATNKLVAGFQNNIPKKISNIQVLLEKIAKLLMTRVSSNRFTPKAGFRVNVGSLVSDDVELRVSMHNAVSELEQFLLSEQATANFTNEQTLVKLEISQMITDPDDPSRILLEVLVKTKANQTFFVTV
jgi:hypothetical protein